MKLNENQLLFLAFILNEKGIKDKETQGELIDHLATNIENKISEDILFHDALDDAIHEFGEENFLAIKDNRQYLFQQKIKKNMKRVAVLLFLLIGTITLIANNQYPSNAKEIALDKNNEGNSIIVKIHENEPPTVYPVKGDFPIVSTFGKRMHPIHKVIKFHKGIDIKAPIGTDVLASSDGVIQKVKPQSTGYGNHVVIKHDNTFKTLYAQLSTMTVKVGDKVKAGDKIGEVGSSGASTGPHLHYEVIREGEKVNPEDYVSL
jgi:murein DD-endopeptidase MepM/ murein hydrolase activator NlpD